MDQAYAPHVSKVSLLAMLGSKKGDFSIDDVLTAENPATFDYTPPQPGPVVEKVLKPKDSYGVYKKTAFQQNWWVYTTMGNCMTSIAIITETMWLHAPALALVSMGIIAAISPKWTRNKYDNNLKNNYDKIDKGYSNKGYKHLDDKF